MAPSDAAASEALCGLGAPQLPSACAYHVVNTSTSAVSDLGDDTSSGYPSPAHAPGYGAHGMASTSGASPRGRGRGWRRGWSLGGRVHRAMEEATGNIFAIKSFDLKQDGLGREGLEEELRRLEDLRHPNLVSVLGHECIGENLILHLEYMPEGSMAAFIGEFGPLNGENLLWAINDLLRGLQYLHTRRPPVAHGNVKGANLLIDSNICLKLTDFGCSELETGKVASSSLSSLPWSAPEVIQQRIVDKVKADIWSAGCAVLEMATAECPWGREASLDSILQALGAGGATPAIPDALPRAVREVLRLCLRRAPAERACASGLLWYVLAEQSAGPPGRAPF